MCRFSRNRHAGTPKVITTRCYADSGSILNSVSISRFVKFTVTLLMIISKWNLSKMIDKIEIRKFSKSMIFNVEIQLLAGKKIKIKTLRTILQSIGTLKG